MPDIKESSIIDTPPVGEGGPPSRDLLPKEVTTKTDFGQLAADTLALIERQTGVPVTNTDKIFDFSEMKYSADVPAMASTEDGSWIVQARKGKTDKGSTRTLPDADSIIVTVGHVGKVHGGSPIFDREMQVLLLRGSNGETRGEVTYEDIGAGFFIRAGDAVVHSAKADIGDQARVYVAGDQGGSGGNMVGRALRRFEEHVYSTSLGDMDSRGGAVAHKILGSRLFQKGRSLGESHLVPAALGDMVDSLPQKDKFEIHPVGTTTKSVVNS
ncbi:hypothetical protein ACFL2C_03235 [Patescibacteria group bacterium]